jgi:hypothetical protein
LLRTVEVAPSGGGPLAPPADEFDAVLAAVVVEPATDEVSCIWAPTAAPPAAAPVAEVVVVIVICLDDVFPGTTPEPLLLAISARIAPNHFISSSSVGAHKRRFLFVVTILKVCDAESTPSPSVIDGAIP